MTERTPTKRFSAATSVCRTCNGNIICKNHPLDLFGEKAIKEGIARDLEKFSGLKISFDDGLPSRICRTCYGKVTKFQEFVKMVMHSKAQQDSVMRSKRGKSVQQSPSSTTSPGVGRDKKRSKVSYLYAYLIRILQSNCLCVNVPEKGTFTPGIELLHLSGTVTPGQ